MATEIDRATCLGWRKFIQTEYGMKGMLFLREREPRISMGDADSIIFQAGVIEGYRRAIETIPEILATEPATKDVNYDNDR